MTMLHYLLLEEPGRLKTQKLYIKIRSFKNFQASEFRQQILDHWDYILTLHEMDTKTISINTQKIIKQSLDVVAPIKMVQISNKNSNKLSENTRTLLAERDLAHDNFRKNKTPENLRAYKNIKNHTNKEISKEIFLNKVKLFKSTENESSKKKWETIKNVAGKKVQKTPLIITERGGQHTTPKGIASSLNHQFVQRITNLIRKLPNPTEDPLVDYQKILGPNELSLKFKTVSMSQLKLCLSNMKASNSSTEDYISIKAIKCAQNEILPLILKLVNRIIETGDFPENLKTTKIVPIAKKGKDTATAEGWRPINIVNAIAKIVENVLLKQWVEHLNTHDLIKHGHHGGSKGKSTQSLVLEIFNELVENKAEGKAIALILMDQSKAFRGNRPRNLA